jgi:ice-binding like protein
MRRFPLTVYFVPLQLIFHLIQHNQYLSPSETVVHTWLDSCTIPSVTSHQVCNYFRRGENNMCKRFKNNLWVIALFLGISMTGCGGNGGDSPSSTGGAAGSGAATTGNVSVSAAAVPLGAAANYALLAKSGVSTVPSSVVTGNVGLSPAARGFLTGWSLITEPTDTSFTSAQVVAPGKLYAADNVGGTTSVDLTTAVADMGTAYTNAAGRAATSAATTNVGAGTLTSLTLTPGVYEWGSAVTIPTDLTLAGGAADVWIFKVAQTLDMAAAKSVILSGGALPQNIFWQVAGAVNIGANTHFEGIILGQTSITFGTKASINGRLLAQSAIVLDATTVTVP